jgi:predicted nucleotide-binding protein
MPNALLKNGGQPLDAIDMASALSISPGSSTLRTLNSAASAYGLTGGSYKTRFTMGDLGEQITSPRSPGEKATALLEASLRPPLFKNVFDYYRGKRYPEERFLINALKRDFGVADGQASQAAQIITDNFAYVGLLRETRGGLWLSGSASLDGQPVEDSDADGVIDDDDADVNDGGDEAEAPQLKEDLDSKGRDARSRPNQIFIGHGKNKQPLAQLTQTLKDLGIPHVVAELEPNLNRPISQKVRDTMEQCGAAILIFSADEEYFDADGNSVWKPSENVSHELGAASVMYDNRVIMFKESTVRLASNYSGIGYIEYAPNSLDAKINELLRELIGLRILKVSVD